MPFLGPLHRCSEFFYSSFLFLSPPPFFPFLMKVFARFTLGIDNSNPGICRGVMEGTLH